jgi:hypothetical protein
MFIVFIGPRNLLARISQVGLSVLMLAKGDKNTNRARWCARPLG